MYGNTRPWGMPILLGSVMLFGAMLRGAGADSPGEFKTIVTNGTGFGASGVGEYHFDPVDAINHLVSSNLGENPPSTGLDINTLVGANRFYNAGYTGGNSVVANVEAGHIWNGHEALGHLAQQIHDMGANAGAQTAETERHSTWVGMTIGGRLGGAVQGEYQRGISYNATLWSGAIATTWNGAPYALGFNFNGDTFLTPYNTVFAAGIAGRTADVVNSSWGFTQPSGANFFAAAVDALSNANPRTTMVTSAGNAGPGANTVGGIGAGYNAITVAALNDDTDAPPYDTVAGFSSRSPNDYEDPVNGLVAGVRAAVDIAAPGQSLTSAYYGGTTGGNNPALGAPVGVNAAANLYSGNLAGTSFSAPIVAGGATLVTDAGYANFPGNANARDNRVVKAVLQNSADKDAAWNNGQALVGPTVTTTQSLDYETGAGRMNLDTAFDQYLSGTTDVAGLGGGNNLNPIGWDYGQVVQGVDNNYFIGGVLKGGTTFTATLAWYRNRSLNLATQTAFDDSFDDLDLLVFAAPGGVPTTLVGASVSTFNNVEHLAFTLPSDGEYMIRVNWFQEVFDVVGDANQELYGLAWSATVVPVPSTVWMGLGLLVACGLVKGIRAGTPAGAPAGIRRF